MNPFFEQQERFNKLNLKINKMGIQSRQLEKKIKEIEESVMEIQASCTHKYEDETSSVERMGQEPGSGKSLGECQLCKLYTYTRYFK